VLTSSIAGTPTEWTWERELFSLKPRRVTFKVDGAAPLVPVPDGGDDFAALASLIDFAEHPELLGHELITLLLSAHCAGPIALVSRLGSGKEEVIAYAGCEYPDAATLSGSATCTKRLALGKTRGREFELLVSAPDDLGTQTRLLAIEKVLHAGLALHRARLQQREEASPLPVDPIVDSDIGVFAAPSMLQLLAVARKASTSTIGILITGETGTGKEILARAIHESSPRSGRTFIPFNCVAVPREMLDSQLFGYRRGAFTGAAEAFTGVIRGAAGGTLFLDEIGELPLELQPKLLRFLDTRDIHPIGEAQPVNVDVRVIAATNRNLDELVKDGRFREDLYYRLNIMRFQVPPLRERREEIPLLVQHFLRRSSDELQKQHVRIADETLEYLVLYRWPGNVRQLANEIRRMVALAEPRAVLMPEHLDPTITAGRRTVTTVDRETAPLEFLVRMDQPLAAAFEHVERTVVPYALTVCKGSLEDAAKLLGITRKGLYLKRQRLGF
ncbi:MAG: sigma-54-dependent Fis family transcriptional regulator, partial [Acidobacteria bacterium]|nr:sigma-54-dependent Fis family transcriptional regulator [Acidobacteriota bacterium]